MVHSRDCQTEREVSGDERIDQCLRRIGILTAAIGVDEILTYHDKRMRLATAPGTDGLLSARDEKSDCSK